MLAGLVHFREYLHRMGKCSSPFCSYEKKEALEDGEHTFFSCYHRAENRQLLGAEIGVLSPTNVVMKMMNSRESWNAVKQFVEYAL